MTDILASAAYGASSSFGTAASGAGIRAGLYAMSASTTATRSAPASAPLSSYNTTMASMSDSSGTIDVTKVGAEDKED